MGSQSTQVASSSHSHTAASSHYTQQGAINPSARHKQRAVISYVLVTKGTHGTTTKGKRRKLGAHFLIGNRLTYWHKASGMKDKGLCCAFPIKHHHFFLNKAGPWPLETKNGEKSRPAEIQTFAVISVA